MANLDQENLDTVLYLPATTANGRGNGFKKSKNFQRISNFEDLVSLTLTLEMKTVVNL